MIPGDSERKESEVRERGISFPVKHMVCWKIKRHPIVENHMRRWKDVSAFKNAISN